MSLHADLRAVDRRRATQALTAWTYDDAEALHEVLTETNNDPDGPGGLIYALLTYADWIARNTAPLLSGDPGPGPEPM